MLAPLLALALAGSACSLPQPLSPAEAADRLAVASSFMYASDGSVIANLHGTVNRQAVTLGDVPQHLVDAVVAAEDGRYWIHPGVDPLSIGRALVANVRNPASDIQGGSTITQQLVKNLYLPDEGRTVDRKAVEAVLAVGLDARHSKDEILEMYLNTMYLGRGAYGVGAAAKAYFGKPVSEISIAEAAFLAGVIHSPGRYDLVASSAPEETHAAVDRGRARRNWVLDRMVATETITPAIAQKEKETPLDLRPVPRTQWTHPYFVDMVLRTIGVLGAKSDDDLDRRFDVIGTTIADRTRTVYEGGLRIHTTIDPRVQQAAEVAVAEVLNDQPERLSASVVVLDPRTGDVKALVGGRDYYPTGCDDETNIDDLPAACGRSKVNIALGSRGGGSGRQPGSGFKPIVLAQALESGLSLGDRFSAKPFTHKLPSGTWKVENYSGSGGGSMNLLDATRKSVNAAYARLEIEGIGGGDALAGSSKVAEMARRLGIDFETPDAMKQRCGDSYNQHGGCTPADSVPAIALGAKEVAPIDLAVAYATLANDGVRATPFAIARIDDASGRTLYQAEVKAERALEPRTARTVTHALRSVVEAGTATRAELADGRPVAGKTGTSQQWRDAWFTGYVPQLVASVWVGNPTLVKGRDGRAVVESMIPSNGYGKRVTGGSYPAMIWKKLMDQAVDGLPRQDFPPPPEGAMKPTRTPAPDAREESDGENRGDGGQGAIVQAPVGGVPGVVGMPLASAVSRLQRAGYWASIQRGCGQGRALHVYAQSPGGGARAPRGSSVTVWYQPAGGC